jgi:hypothetical protein
MEDIFTKNLGVHSRLNLDEEWTEHALTSIRDNSWRVLLRPIAIDNHRFLARVDECFICNFELVDGILSWSYFDNNYLTTIEHHLEVLPLLIRDLSDSSKSLYSSSSHCVTWKENAKQAISILDDLDFPELTSEIRTLLLASLMQVCTEDIPCEMLIHGDFHPGNVMISGNRENPSATVIDLENLTFGSFFVDALYCSTWARLVSEPSRYWDLISYLELKSNRKIGLVDIGLTSSLMLNQAHNNSIMTSRRIVLGLFWMVNEMLKQKRIDVQ